VAVLTVVELRVTGATLLFVNRALRTDRFSFPFNASCILSPSAAQSARPSVELKTEEEHKVANADLGNATLAEFVDESTRELTVHLDYSNHPEVLWPLIHVLSMRPLDGSQDMGGTSAHEVLRVAIAHFECLRPHFRARGEHFAEDFMKLEPALTIDHINMLVPILIHIL
ncbi:hypothetical protein PMAYCL1PPCAC_03114, partial [Pristionchus mayeri]